MRGAAGRVVVVAVVGAAIHAMGDATAESGRKRRGSVKLSVVLALQAVGVIRGLVGAGVVVAVEVSSVAAGAVGAIVVMHAVVVLPGGVAIPAMRRGRTRRARARGSAVQML